MQQAQLLQAQSSTNSWACHIKVWWLEATCLQSGGRRRELGWPLCAPRRPRPDWRKGEPVVAGRHHRLPLLPPQAPPSYTSLPLLPPRGRGPPQAAPSPTSGCPLSQLAAGSGHRRLPSLPPQAAAPSPTLGDLAAGGRRRMPSLPPQAPPCPTSLPLLPSRGRQAPQAPPSPIWPWAGHHKLPPLMYAGMALFSSSIR